MALGDILSGFAEAGHEHNTNLLNMQFQQAKDLSEKYLQISQDPDSPPEVRNEATNRMIGLHTLEPGKKIPKEWTNFSFTVQPKPQAPTQLPSVPSMVPGLPDMAPAPPPVAPPPTDPYQMSLGTRYTPQQKEEMANTVLTGQMATKSAAEVTDRQNLYDQIKRMNPGISDKLATEYALKIPASMINPPQSTVNNVAGSDITLEKDSAGMPIDKKPGMLYSVRLNQAGEMVSATPTLNPQGTMRWAQDENQHWIGFTTNKSGQVTRHTDIGLTPPQGVPLDSIEHGFKLAGQADGSTVLVPVTTVTERGRGIGGSTGAPSPSTGVPVPTAPPAPGEAPVAKPASPQASVNPGGAVRVGAKSLNPEQVMKASQNAEAYMRTVGRMASVLDRFGKVDMSSVIKRAQMKIASNPDGTMKLVVADNSKLTPDESSLAADYASLGEDVQLLRAVDQATGFRGQQAFEALLGQRGNMLGNPDVFKKVLKNSMESLVQQLRPMVKTLNESGQPVGEVPDGVIRAYQIIANGDFAKAKAAMKRDGWVK